VCLSHQKSQTQKNVCLPPMMNDYSQTRLSLTHLWLVDTLRDSRLLVIVQLQRGSIPWVSGPSGRNLACAGLPLKPGKWGVSVPPLRPGSWINLGIFSLTSVAELRGPSRTPLPEHYPDLPNSPEPAPGAAALAEPQTFCAALGYALLSLASGAPGPLAITDTITPKKGGEGKGCQGPEVRLTDGAVPSRC